jgi:transposase
MNPSRTPYPSDVSDDEWAFVAPYFTLLPEDAGQRTHSLREGAERLALDRPRRSAVAHDAQ